MKANWDALFVALALCQGLLLMLAPSIWLLALGLWWNANTISHNFIHRPFFRSRTRNAIFSAYLSLVLGIPQSLWRERHLAHHAGRAWRWHYRPALVLEAMIVMLMWSLLAALVPDFFLRIYLPGWLGGLFLCYLQGYYEHARGIVSHYGRLYNFLFFNDGYHVEHHAKPGEHWTRLPGHKKSAAPASRWPAVLRWLEWPDLDTLERLVVKSKRLQDFVLRKHERAFRQLLQTLPAVRQVVIVGGGLFPRTALVLQRLQPNARLTIIDANAEHLQCARAFLQGDVDFLHQFFDLGHPGDAFREADLVVIPLAFVGDRAAIYQQPPAPHVLVHDWWWRRRGRSVPISLLLLKRLNLVQQ